MSRIEQLTGHRALGLATVFLATAAALYSPARVHAATTTFVATADARVEQANRSSRFGTSKLKAGGGSALIRSYIKFSPANLSGTVNQATLSIVPLDSSTVGFSARAAASSSWKESSVTWSNAPRISSTVVSSSGAYGCCGRVSVNVTPLVKGNGPVTFVVTSAASSADSYKNRERGASSAPQLVVTTAGSTDPGPPLPPGPIIGPTDTPAPTDTLAPSAPTGLAPVPGYDRVSLSWDASTDNVGTAGYRVYRGGAQVAQTSSTSYTDLGLSNGTSYSYYVVAYDAAGNVSPASKSVLATTAVPPPTSSTYYVATNGSDANPGSAAAPWRTIGHAAGVVAPGSTVVIGAGSYAEDVTVSRSGAPGSPTAFRGSGASVRSFTVEANHIVISGLTIAGVTGTEANNLTVYGDDILVEQNDLTGTRNDVVNMWGDHQTYRRNVIHDVSNSIGNHNDVFQTWTGLHDGAEGNPVTNLLIEQNIVRNVTGSNAHCLMSEGPGHHDWTIRNNVFVNVGDQCLIFGKDGNGSQGIQNVSIYNNTFVGAGHSNTIEFNLSTTAKLANNIFYNCAGWGGDVPYHIARNANVVHGYNLAGGTTTRLAEAGAVNASPLFVTPTSDFHLAAGSPAINAGDNGALVSPPRSYDLDGGNPVGVVDIGAYEHQG